MVLGALALLAMSATPANVRAQDTPCAVWVVRNALESPASWRRALAAVEETGCRRMYLQVSGRWDELQQSWNARKKSTGCLNHQIFP